MTERSTRFLKPFSERQVVEVPQGRDGEWTREGKPIAQA